jgi:DNA-binding transcriptional MocR family regulator
VRIAEPYGARVLPVRVGPPGIDVQQICDHLACGVRIKLVDTVSDFHTPRECAAGGRSRPTVDLAQCYGFIASENPYPTDHNPCAFAAKCR